MDAPAALRHHRRLALPWDGRMRLAMRMMAVAGLWLVLGTALAQRVEGDRPQARGPYQAEVTVTSQGEAQRRGGFTRAMVEVLQKLTGDRGVAERPGLARELRQAGDYVEGYDYRQDEGVSPLTGAPTYGTTLIVRFDQDKLDDLVAGLGLPVWAQPRPKPVLWLAIDDGSGARLVGVGKSAAARSVLDRAQDRGYRLGLPTGTAAEQAAVGAIWRGDTSVITRLSARYQPPMQLIGKLYRGGDGWIADWIFVDHGRVLSRWTSTDRDARRAMAAGADGAADALVARYAKAPVLGPPGQYRVLFTGVHGSAGYMRLAGYLEQMPVVRGITPLRATPDQLEVQLDLASGLEGFRRLLDEDVLEDTGAVEPATFRLR
jgi:hypothetical protein